MTTILKSIEWALPGVDTKAQPLGDVLRAACLKVFADGVSPANEHVQALRKGLRDMNQKAAINLGEQFEIKQPKQIEDGDSIGLRPLEKKVLENLSDAWNTYMLLPRPSNEEMADFRSSVDRCHDLIARRVARRVDPDVWS